MWRPEDVGVPGGETLRDFADRVASVLDGLSRRHLGETVVVVAHAGVLDAAVRWAVGIPSDRPWQSEMPLANASLTAVRVWPDGRVPGGSPFYAAIDLAGDALHLAGIESDL